MNQAIYVVMGVSGCGKSTVGQLLAVALAVEFLEGDQLHSVDNIAKMAAGIALGDDDRRDWLQILSERIAFSHTSGKGLVLSCSALKRAYRDTLRKGCSELCFIHLHGDPAVLEARMANRPGHYMPPSLLQSQLAALELPGPDENVQTFDVAMMPAEIVALVLATTLSKPQTTPHENTQPLQT